MVRSVSGRRAAPGRPAAFVGAAALLALAAPLSAQAPEWQVDTASATFVVRNAGLPVHGSFDGVEARVCFDPAHPEGSSLSGAIDPTTIRTGIDIRDRHLQRHEWFNVPRYGMVEMRSVRLRRAPDGYVGTFALRIRDAEHEVEVPFTFERKGGTAHIAGALTIDRLDYGLGKPSVILADEVDIQVELELVASATGVGRADHGGPCR